MFIFWFPVRPKAGIKVYLDGDFPRCGSGRGGHGAGQTAATNARRAAGDWRVPCSTGSSAREGSNMNPVPEFEQNPGFVADLTQFLVQNRKWWLIPIILVFAVVGLLLILGGTSAAPFIYSLF
jgi:hypothetical protein